MLASERESRNILSDESQFWSVCIIILENVHSPGPGVGRSFFGLRGAAAGAGAPGSATDRSLFCCSRFLMDSFDLLNLAPSEYAGAVFFNLEGLIGE